MELGLTNKNVLITGSTKGLGKATAELFVEEGANVIISGRNGNEATSVAAEINNKYGIGRAYAIQSDLSEEGVAEKLFEKSCEKLGSLDILVNNAGIWPTAYVEEMEKPEFEKTIYLNLEVPYILSRYMVKHLKENNKTGKIINVVSQAAFHGSTTGHAHYAASKAGLVTFTKSLAREVAKDGIQVNAVAPGMMITPMTEEAYRTKAEYYDNRIPLGYAAKPEQVGYAVVFLASEKADYFTGITFDATGGMLMR